MNKIKTYWDSLSETIVLTKKEQCLLLKEKGDKR